MASKAGKKRKIVGNRNTKLFYYARVFSFLFVVLFFSSSTSCFFFSLLVARTCASCQKRIQHWRRIACNFPISNERYFCIKFILHHPMCDVCVCVRVSAGYWTKFGDMFGEHFLFAVFFVSKCIYGHFAVGYFILIGILLKCFCRHRHSAIACNDGNVLKTVLFAHHSARMRITRMEYERINLELSVSTATNPPFRKSFRQFICGIDPLATAGLQLIYQKLPYIVCDCIECALEGHKCGLSR